MYLQYVINVYSIKEHTPINVYIIKVYYLILYY